MAIFARLFHQDASGKIPLGGFACAMILTSDLAGQHGTPEIEYTFKTYWPTVNKMRKQDLINEIISTYRKHGWELKTILLRRESADELQNESYLGKEKVQLASVDAIWFSRPSPGQGEAWELRLLTETPYALFHRFAVDEPDEQRAQVLKDMEERMRYYLEAG